MKKTIALILCVLMMVSMLAACGSSKQEEAPVAEAPVADEPVAEAPAEPEYVFKLSVTAPSTGVQADGYNKFKELLEEYSDGRIRVDIYFAGSLAEKVGSLEGLQLGTIEMTELAATDLGAYNPIWDVFGLPYFFEYPLQAIEICNDPEVAAILDADAEANGFKIIAWTTFGSRNVFNTVQPINTVEDMSALKIRVMSSPTLISCMEDLGANSISLPWTECYAAMEQGTINAVENATALMISNGFVELGGYYSFTQHFIVPDPILVSKVVYDSLPADLQEAVDKAGAGMEEFWNYTLWDSYENASLDEMKERGIEITYPDLTEFFEIAATSIEEAVSGWNDEQVEFYNLVCATKAEYQNG